MYYLPYKEGSPTTVEINGHRLLLVCAEADCLREGMGSFGATEIRELELENDLEIVLSDLALQTQSGIVITPPGVSITDVVDNLEKQLPWVN